MHLPSNCIVCGKKLIYVIRKYCESEWKTAACPTKLKSKYYQNPVYHFNVCKGYGLRITYHLPDFYVEYAESFFVMNNSVATFWLYVLSNSQLTQIRHLTQVFQTIEELDDEVNKFPLYFQ